MTGSSIDGRDFSQEFIFRTSRSSGPGGQHVNKTSTKVELRFNVSESRLLSVNEKQIIMEKLAGRISNEGFLIITSQSERSQLLNKEKTIEKFYSLLEKALKPVKKRKAIKLPEALKEKRLQEKKIKAEKKSLRKNPETDAV
ncbi:MAG: alternative ribosome rescue aminoacyl-tRNA hydrolase ArfB [Bacteroidota bacterium]